MMPPEIAANQRRWRELWRLRPGVSYLNHGSFGPSPLAVQERREHWSRELESEPMDFFLRILEPQLAKVRQRLAGFVGCASDDLIFVDNATTGMNIVAASWPLSAGDEVLLNDHEYGAVRRIWERACRRAGATLVVANLPAQVESEQHLLAAMFAAATANTRMIVVSHITSPTAIIMPVREICREASRRGIAVCVDGPHAPGMIDIDLARLGCDFYTASCHKWLCAPFGSGFLYSLPWHQQRLEPVVKSWGRPPAGEAASWRDEFTWLGTRDYAAWLTIDTAIDFVESLPLGAFRAATHLLAKRFRDAVTKQTGLPPLTPDASSWYGSMVAVPLPAGDAAHLQDRLWREHHIELPIVDLDGRRLARISCHAYNTEEEVDRAVGCLMAELKQEK